MAKIEHSSGFSDEASDDGEELRMPPPPLDWELNCLLTHLNQEMTKDDLDSAKALFQGLFIKILTCLFFYSHHQFYRRTQQLYYNMSCPASERIPKKTVILKVRQLIKK